MHLFRHGIRINFGAALVVDSLGKRRDAKYEQRARAATCPLGSALKLGAGHSIWLAGVLWSDILRAAIPELSLPIDLDSFVVVFLPICHACRVALPTNVADCESPSVDALLRLRAVSTPPTSQPLHPAVSSTFFARVLFSASLGCVVVNAASLARVITQELEP